MNFSVSVIIPVYNAVRYIERAVESAVHLEETGEVVLVDDGYPDGALEVCRKLANQYPKVKLFQHPNGENRGAGASRNLAVEHASCPYIAFLDADDYFLPHRFKKTKEVFASDPEVDAVYEPIGTDFMNEQARRDFCKWKRIPLSSSEGFITYPSKTSRGKEFFTDLLRGGIVYPSIIGITVRKELMDKYGKFNTELKLHQDSELLIRLAYYGVFAPGERREPVSMRYAHLENRISRRNIHSIHARNKTIYQWTKTLPLSDKDARYALRKYLSSGIPARFNHTGFLTKVLWRVCYYGIVAFNPRYWR